MTDQLTKRLDEILPTVIRDDLLSGVGLGNEIAFYIFDYSPEDELRVREHIEFLLDQIPKHRPGTRVKHINLFELVLQYLKDRKLLDAAFKMQQEKGDEALHKALNAPLHADKLARVFEDAAQPKEHDLILVSGVGNVWPMLRSHSLLNNLHRIIGITPLIMFFPGQYDGQSLRLFGKLKDNNYYRAFKLVP